MDQPHQCYVNFSYRMSSIQQTLLDSIVSPIMCYVLQLNETHFLGIHSFPPAFEALTGDGNIFSSLLKKGYPQADLLFYLAQGKVS